MAETKSGSERVRVLATLEEAIIFGHLRPRERLIEDDLMARFRVKRHIIRQVLSDLERLGFVAKEPNKGAMVRDFSADEVEHIYEMREILQDRAARRIPLPAPRGLVEELEDIHRQHLEATAAGDLRRTYQLNDRFHGTLFGACGNLYLADDIARYERLSHAIRSLGDPAQLRKAQKEHAAMIRALAKGDRRRLVRLAVDHIKSSKDAYLALHRSETLA
jgi:DNA-binding GntR family transcriptional regulator